MSATNKKRTDYSKATKRSEPFGVRMDKTLLDQIKKEQGLKTMQSVVDFLAKEYEKSIAPSFGNPVLDRNGLVETKIESTSPAGIKIQSGKSVKFRPPAGAWNGGDLPIGAKDEPSQYAAPLKVLDGLIDERIIQLEKELKNGPPSDFSALAKKNYIFDRKKELESLKANNNG